ncbi:hypothetical protein D3C72_2481410 [compost metagenome]
MGFRMRQQNGILIGHLGFHPLEGGEIRMLQRDVERTQPIRPLGMARWRDVFQENRVFVEARGHGFSLCCAT